MKKKDETVIVSYADYCKAELTWNYLYNGGKHWPHYFATFIGGGKLWRFYRDGNSPGMVFLQELAARKVAMLCSPHACTLMQAFIIRTGYHKKLPT